jgi:Rha family phage regulatory protein
MSDLSPLAVATLPPDAVTLRHGVPMTTSLVVAETFHKQHFHVLRDIDALDCSPEFARSNFGLAEFIDKNGDPRRLFELTRNGFLFLAMGYRGPKAAALKEAYIARFDAMAAELARPPRPVPIDDTVTVALAKDDYIRHLEHKLGRSYRVAAVPVPAARPVAGRPVTADEIAEALRLFNAGASRGAIARAIHRHTRTVGRILDRAACTTALAASIAEDAA